MIHKTLMSFELLKNYFRKIIFVAHQTLMSFELHAGIFFFQTLMKFSENRLDLQLQFEVGPSDEILIVNESLSILVPYSTPSLKIQELSILQS